jgi:hypothetical protein
MSPTGSTRLKRARSYSRRSAASSSNPPYDRLSTESTERARRRNGRLAHEHLRRRMSIGKRPNPEKAATSDVIAAPPTRREKAASLYTIAPAETLAPVAGWDSQGYSRRPAKPLRLGNFTTRSRDAPIASIRARDDAGPAAVGGQDGKFGERPGGRDAPYLVCRAAPIGRAETPPSPASPVPRALYRGSG